MVGTTARLVAESTAIPKGKPLVTPRNDDSLRVRRSAVTIVGGPQKLLKSAAGVDAWFLAVFCPMPSNTGNPIEATAGLRSIKGPNVLVVMSDVSNLQAALLLGALKSKARNTAWSFAWLAAPSPIWSVSGDGGVHADPIVPLATSSRL